MDINAQELLRSKVTILYILNYFSIPLTIEQFLEFMLEQDYLNYFDINEFVNQLISDEMVETSFSENEEYIMITDNGKETIELFENDIAQAIRRKINDAIDNKKRSFNLRTNINAEYVKIDDNEYNVQLSINEGNLRLMFIDVSVLTNKDAKNICENWKKNARYLYGDLLKTLSDSD